MSAPTAPTDDRAVPASAARPRPDGRLALGLAASLLLIGAACRELLRFQPRTNLVVSLSGEAEHWFFEPSDTSALLVLAFSGWLLWRRRARLAPLWGRRAPFATTAALWAAAGAIFVWSVRAGAPDLQALALVPGLLGAAHALGGPAALRVALLPAAVLLFAMPVPAPLLNQVVWKLQIWTADFTGLLLWLLRFPTLVSGDRIFTGDGVFAIIETCSGQRAIETLLLLTVLMADLFGRRGWHALLLLVAAPPVAFLINGLRCLGLIFNPHADVASIHTVQGIAMLLGGVLLLYFLDGRLQAWLPAAPRISAVERRVRAEREARAPLAPRVAAIVGFAALLFALSWLPRFPLTRVAPPERPIALLDAAVDEDWERGAGKTDWLFLGKALFRHSTHRRYTRGAEEVEVFLGPVDPRRRMRSYLSPKTAYPGSGWLIEHEERTELIARPVTLRVLRRGAERRLVAHWFEAPLGVGKETLRTWLALDRSPLPRTRLPLAVRVSTPLASAHPRARELALERLARFGAQIDPALKEMATPRG